MYLKELEFSVSVFLRLESALPIFMVKRTEVADVVISRMSATKISLGMER